jgi:hypothetical protein
MGTGFSDQKCGIKQLRRAAIDLIAACRMERA